MRAVILCLIESIKCHHNDICEYIKNNLINFDKIDPEEYENLTSSILCHHNYLNFPNDFDTDDEFFYLCKFNYNELAHLFVKKKEKFLIKPITISTKTNYKVLMFYYSMLTDKYINTRIFDSKYNITKVVIPHAIPHSITRIRDKAFCECLYLKQIKIPSSVTSIGHSSFIGCESLTENTLPTSVIEIGNYAFTRCSS